jgi:hypothetical protein
MLARLLGEARRERIDVRVRPYLGTVEEQFLAPDQACILAQLHHALEEALEDSNAQPGTDPSQTGVVGQWLVECVAEVPPVREVEAGNVHELPLRPAPLEEEDELKLEEDNWVDTRPPAIGVPIGDPLPDKGQVELVLELTVEIVCWDVGVQGDRH